MSLDVRELDIEGLKLIVPRRFGDPRGIFHESWHRARYETAGLAHNFIQDNMSISREAGTVRGLHFQHAPFAQAKLVMVPHGRIYDVAVDLRRGSPTFCKWIAVELSHENGHQLLVPAGFAHGFCTLEPDTTVMYKVDNYYAPDHEGGILWSDPDLKIAWPVTGDRAIVSAKDGVLPLFKDLVATF